MTKATKLTKGEKVLLLAVGLFVALLLGIVYLRYTLEINPVITLPALVLPQANAFGYCVRASELLDKQMGALGESRFNDLERFCRPHVDGQAAVQTPTMAGQPAPTWEMAAAFAKGAAPAFAILRQGFASDCHAIPCRSYAHDTSFYIKTRNLARALAITGRVNAHYGDWAGATTCALDAMQLGAESEHGSDVSAYRVGRACQYSGHEVAWAAIPHLSGAQARAAARRMETVMACTPPYADLLQPWKYAGLADLKESLDKPGWRKEVFGLGPGYTYNRYSYLDTWKITFTSKRDVVQNFIRVMDGVIANAKQPAGTQPAYRVDPANPLNQINEMIIFDKFHFFKTSDDTQNALLLASYALQAYHAEHGRYPGKLSELIPAYLQAIPNGPFAMNRPLCYKPGGMHAILYSIGPDGIDHGGKASSDGQENAKPPKLSIRSTSTGDIVAGVNVR